ncbi:hypothetical protein PD5205_03027 [Xanthomonas fragariae]|uniref:Uncharacterized protein n=1 Tax=Xanthomonas fragariae TaxID=48664 RepID=A0A1Y6HPX6_9XANT|nr:hypothetical protein [Xanthomonas fragariae]SMQ98226.1 hypothetical protein PD885_00968 [Xanthomonas fragariae]SMR04310.1 hypothetical protein PD5205_03027 [Xanthomonas fragariae]
MHAIAHSNLSITIERAGSATATQCRRATAHFPDGLVVSGT